MTKYVWRPKFECKIEIRTVLNCDILLFLIFKSEWL